MERSEGSMLLKYPVTTTIYIALQKKNANIAQYFVTLLSVVCVVGAGIAQLV
jgi:hypothetical protein